MITSFRSIQFSDIFSVQDFTQNALYTVAYLIGALIVLNVSRRMVRFTLQRMHNMPLGRSGRTQVLKQRTKTLGTLINNVLSVVIWGIVLTMVLSQWGVNIAPILAGAGVVGLAVGFGAQTLVRDVVTGFFILFENQFNVGDSVELAGKSGKVTAVNLRSTVLKGDDGETYIIPNSRIDVITRSR